MKLLKRWPSMISKCVLSLSENLRNPDSPENAVLGSCAILATQTVLKHMTVVAIRTEVFKQITSVMKCS